MNQEQNGLHGKGQCMSAELTEEELRAANSEAYYQAQQDWQRGGKNPEEAFKDRGFKKNKNGRWVFR